MEEHIEYYTDLIAHLNEQINQENIKLIDYESMLIHEQKTLSEYSFFRRLFSNNKKFIIQLEKLVNKSTVNIENYKKSIEDNKEKFVIFGTQQMIEESTELSDIEKKIAGSITVSDNIRLMIVLMNQSKDDCRAGIKWSNGSKAESFKAGKNNYFEKSFNAFLSAINRANDLKRYMTLEGFSTIGDSNKAFNNNTLEVINDILSYDKIFSSNIIEKMKASTKNPHFELLENKIDVMERIERNFELLTISFNRELENIKAAYSDLIIKKSEIQNNYRVLFLNKIKRNNSLVIF